MLGTNGLAPAGKVLRGSHGAMMTDGLLIEAKAIVGGYVMISAESQEEAVEQARGRPGLDSRMEVEVRPVVERDGKGG